MPVVTRELGVPVSGLKGLGLMADIKMWLARGTIFQADALIG
jgi:hypothetical protein